MWKLFICTRKQKIATPSFPLLYPAINTCIIKEHWSKHNKTRGPETEGSPAATNQRTSANAWSYLYEDNVVRWAAVTEYVMVMVCRHRRCRSMMVVLLFLSCSVKAWWPITSSLRCITINYLSIYLSIYLSSYLSTYLSIINLFYIRLCHLLNTII